MIADSGKGLKINFKVPLYSWIQPEAWRNHGFTYWSRTLEAEDGDLFRYPIGREVVDGERRARYAAVGTESGMLLDTPSISTPAEFAAARGHPNRHRTFDRESYWAREGGTASVTVRMSPAADREVSLPIRIEAAAGPEESDYSHELGEPPALSFGTGDVSRRFEIRAVRDADGEDETVSLGFGALPERVSAGAPSRATLTLAEGPAGGARDSSGESKVVRKRNYDQARRGEPGTITPLPSSVSPSSWGQVKESDR